MIKVRSQILTAEAVANEGRAFGSALLYYPAYVVFADRSVPALFTRAQLDAAISRAMTNPEDVMPQYEPPFPVAPEPSLWARLFGWMAR